jgi:hypothetical protein
VVVVVVAAAVVASAVLAFGEFTVAALATAVLTSYEEHVLFVSNQIYY